MNENKMSFHTLFVFSIVLEDWNILHREKVATRKCFTVRMMFKNRDVRALAVNGEFAVAALSLADLWTLFGCGGGHTKMLKCNL